MTMLLEPTSPSIPFRALEGNLATPQSDLPVFDESMLKHQNEVRVARWWHGVFELCVKVGHDETTTHDEYESLKTDRGDPRHDPWEITKDGEVRLPTTNEGNRYLISMDYSPFEILKALLEQGLSISLACLSTMNMVAKRAESLMDWLNDEWTYVWVELKITKGNRVIHKDSCLGVEDRHDYLETFVNGVIHDFFE